MGGNLFKLGRLPKADYIKLEQELCKYLDEKFATHYRIPRYYADKPDFGDMDIVLSTNAIKGDWQQLKQEIIQDLNLTQYKSVGAVFSTVYQNFQVDYFVRKAKYFESTYNFLCYNDLGNLIGKIARRFNLKYGEQGLSYVFRRADEHYVKDISLTTDIERIFKFFDLDYDKWKVGFKNKPEMFEWVIASPYFSVVPYKKSSKSLEKRVRERPTIQAFLAYLDEHNINKVYDFQSRESYIPQIAACFPEAKLEEQIAYEKQREAYVNAIRTKFNGKIIIKLFPELEGKELGLFIRDFKSQYSDVETWLYQAKEEIIIQAIKEFYLYWKGEKK